MMKIILIDQGRLVGIGDSVGEAIDSANQVCGCGPVGAVTAHDVRLYSPGDNLSREDGIVYAGLIDEYTANLLHNHMIRLVYSGYHGCFQATPDHKLGKVLEIAIKYD
jgi:hypothetical protein